MARTGSSGHALAHADEVLAELPSPYFVVDLATLRASYAAFQTALPNAAVFYALKANPQEDILNVLAEMGAGFEAASWPEIELCLSLGIDASRVMYGTAVKARSHVELAARAGIDHFAADSAEELQMLAVAAPGARVFIRVHVDDGRSVFQMNSKFGAPVEATAALLRRAASLGLRPWGVSFNVGSQATLATEWAVGIAAIAPVFAELEAEGIRLDVLNLGGGFPVPYRNHPEIPLSKIASHINEALSFLPYQPNLVVEPGRGLAAAAGSLVATVQSRIERRDGSWLFLDCGVYNALYEALLHQGRTEYPVMALGSRALDCTTAKFILAGPTGDGLDVIARDVVMPADLAAGDRLLFENVGAYTRCMASTFNGFPVPPVRIVGV